MVKDPGKKQVGMDVMSRAILAELDELPPPGPSDVPGFRKVELARFLAADEVRRCDLARRYGVSSAAITRFAHRNAALIDDMRREIVAETARRFAGLWIAEKEARLAALEADYELSLNSEYSEHYEHIRVRTQILKQAAEELGELASAITVVPVTHVVVGVEVSDLK